MAIEYATLGGGCFWCLDSVFTKVSGVQSVMSGYSAGAVENPTYQQICTGTTGHAEVIQIAFDNKQVDFVTLLDIFFTIHDPTTLNRQGADVGSQYRSIILCQDEAQLLQAKNALELHNESGHWLEPLVTEVEELGIFYPAETSHQDYFENNPDNRYCQVVITPKLNLFRQRYAHLLNDETQQA